ncbi:MAG: M42 family metallopeptidase [Akkermansiaceae bacterium]
MHKADKNFLFELLKTPSPTGFEMPGQRVWAKYLQPYADSIECDTYGSTWAISGSKKTPSVMLAAHADEIGYMIKHVTKEGFLYIDRVGGSDAATGRGRKIDILGDKETITGIIGNTAIHLRRDNQGAEKAPNVHQLWVDVGASSAKEVAELGIRIGNVAVYQDSPVEMANKRLVSRALDNRIGGFIIAQVMKNIASSKKKISHSLICLNTVQEEIGGAGARMATHRLMPSLCICLDVTHATDTPGIDATQHGDIKLGSGPTVTHGTANHPLIVERLMKLSEEQNIPLQHEASSRFTGTDTDKIYDIQTGVPSALVSLPIRCMHSVVETAHWDDIHATIKLLTAFVISLESSDEFSQKI